MVSAAALCKLFVVAILLLLATRSKSSSAAGNDQAGIPSHQGRGSGVLPLPLPMFPPIWGTAGRRRDRFPCNHEIIGVSE